MTTLGPSSTAGVHGVALAVVLAHEVINQACRKMPKRCIQARVWATSMYWVIAPVSMVMSPSKKQCCDQPGSSTRPNVGSAGVVLAAGHLVAHQGSQVPPAPQIASKFRRGTQSCTPWLGMFRLLAQCAIVDGQLVDNQVAQARHRRPWPSPRRWLAPRPRHRAPSRPKILRLKAMFMAHHQHAHRKKSAARSRPIRDVPVCETTGAASQRC